MKKPSSHHRRRTIAAILAALTLVVALTAQLVKIELDPGAPAMRAGSSKPRVRGPAPVRKFVADSFWQVQWVLGIGDTQGLFAEPRQIIAQKAHAVVLDAGTREVRVVDLHTGRVQLTMTARGVGPGEFKRPSRLVKSPEGFAVLDDEVARLSNFTIRGELLWDFVIPDVFEVAGICIASSESVAVHYARASNNVVYFDTAGSRLAVASVPWTEPRDEFSSFGQSGAMSNATPHLGCAFAPLYGSDWAAIASEGARPPTVFRYHEPGGTPVFRSSDRVLARDGLKVTIEHFQTSESPVVAQGIQLRLDTAIINAWTTSEFPRRILDYHHLESGRYLFSRKLPFIVNAFAIAQDGTFIVSDIGETNQVVMAIRPQTRPDSANKSGLARSATATPLAGTLGRPPAPARARPPANR